MTLQTPTGMATAFLWGRFAFREPVLGALHNEN